MTPRPSAIIWFERLYLAAVVCKVAASVLTWNLGNAGPTQIALIVNLLLWFGVTRRHSTVARWLVVLFTAIGVWTTFTLLLNVAMFAALMFEPAGFTVAAASLLAVIALLLQLGATAHLLRPSATPWFAIKPD